MTENTGTQSSIGRLILGPALLTLALTLLRLVGELSHWSQTWFNPASGQVGPLGAVLILLAPLFGIRFALWLARTGEGPRSVGRAFGYALLGAVMVVTAAFWVIPPFALQTQFTGKLELGYLILTVAAVLQFLGWSPLAKTQLAYGYAARIPIVVIMLLARQGHWGTHFDNLPPGFPLMNFWPTSLYVALLPQLLFWISYTVVSGSLLGTITAVFVKRGAPPS